MASNADSGHRGELLGMMKNRVADAAPKNANPKRRRFLCGAENMQFNNTSSSEYKWYYLR